MIESRILRQTSALVAAGLASVAFGGCALKENGPGKIVIPQGAEYRDREVFPSAKDPNILERKVAIAPAESTRDVECQGTGMEMYPWESPDGSYGVATCSTEKPGDQTVRDAKIVQERF